MTTTPVQQLADIREQWGDLLAAIETEPRADWPPVQLHHQLDTAEHDDRPAVGRLPLTLRQHPAPINLPALDAALSIETAVFALADQIAAAVQRPLPILFAAPEHSADAADADRWHWQTTRDALMPHAAGRVLTATDPRTDRDREREAENGRPRLKGRPSRPVSALTVGSSGSRVNGLHWAAMWVSDRLAATEPTELHGVVRGVLREHAAEVIAAAHRDMTRALGRDGRDTPLDNPCPWCHGQLTARTTSGDPYAAVVTCGTGPTCNAPAPYDTEARRAWHGHLLGQLYGALSAARSAA